MKILPSVFFGGKLTWVLVIAWLLSRTLPNHSNNAASIEIRFILIFPLLRFGSDGTVGANKEAIKMIGNYHKDMFVQAYFEYDAKKSSGWTTSHLRFSPHTPINAPYRVEEGQANYVACHNQSYVEASKFDVVKSLKRRGIFFLNTTVASIEAPEDRLDALEKLVAPNILRQLALKNSKFYIMDAGKLAAKFGLTGRINMICMCAFFRLSGVIPVDDAVALLKSAIVKNYSSKGESVVRNNIDLLDTVVSDPTSMILVEIPASWRNITNNEQQYQGRHLTLIDDKKVRKFMEEIGERVARLEGDEIPISTFLENNLLGGTMIPGTTKYEKRRPNPANRIPLWQSGDCTQCNQCVFVCPHSAIRPFIVTKQEEADAPYATQFETLKAIGPGFAGKRYTLQVSVLDCTGCNACVEACPEQPKALIMGDIESVLESGEKNWDYAVSLPDRSDQIDRYTVRGSQFKTPLFEFSSACSGCGETPYFKLLTQLFGERLLIANATGCSSIWGGSFPSNPYTTSATTGRGPAWANSLFEDNAGELQITTSMPLFQRIFLTHSLSFALAFRVWPRHVQRDEA
jgi:pyruvate-ferredoxin/flavodoxin oxidoreductase